MGECCACAEHARWLVTWFQMFLAAQVVVVLGQLAVWRLDHRPRRRGRRAEPRDGKGEGGR